MNEDMRTITQSVSVKIDKKVYENCTLSCGCERLVRFADRKKSRIGDELLCVSWGCPKRK